MSNATQTAIEMLRPVVAEAASRAAEKSVGLDIGDAAQIATDVTNEVAAVVVNQANLEPWYQSRVTLGALITLVSGTYALGLDCFDGSPPSPDSLTAQLGAIVGAATVLYGRWFARRPLGQ